MLGVGDNGLMGRDVRGGVIGVEAGYDAELWVYGTSGTEAGGIEGGGAISCGRRDRSLEG